MSPRNARNAVRISQFWMRLQADWDFYQAMARAKAS